MSAPPGSVNVQPPPIPMTVNVAPPPGSKMMWKTDAHWFDDTIQFRLHVPRAIEWEIIFMIFTLLSIMNCTILFLTQFVSFYFFVIPFFGNILVPTSPVPPPTPVPMAPPSQPAASPTIYQAIFGTAAPASAPAPEAPLPARPPSGNSISLAPMRSVPTPTVAPPAPTPIPMPVAPVVPPMPAVQYTAPPLPTVQYTAPPLPAMPAPAPAPAVVTKPLPPPPAFAPPQVTLPKTPAMGPPTQPPPPLVIQTPRAPSVQVKAPKAAPVVEDPECCIAKQAKARAEVKASLQQVSMT